MNFNLTKSISILERTPQVLSHLLMDLSEDWTLQNEGENTWSVYDIIGHFIHGEKTDWIPRAKIILNNTSNKNFEAFDRFAQFENSKGKTLNDLLQQFTELRKKNIEILLSMNITKKKLLLKGIHPTFGAVTLHELLSTWLTHDLSHIAQISRVMAQHYKNDIGPWLEFIPFIKK